MRATPTSRRSSGRSPVCAWSLQRPLRLEPLPHDAPSCTRSAVAPRTADPRRAIGIAATYVLGFRATQSTTPLDLDWRPSRSTVRGRLLDAECGDAVAQAWHTDDPMSVETELATYAATHHDAHLAKYTLACLHAAHADPEAAPLFRGAATRLAMWWRDSAPADPEQGDHHDD